MLKKLTKKHQKLQINDKNVGKSVEKDNQNVEEKVFNFDPENQKVATLTRRQHES